MNEHKALKAALSASAVFGALDGGEIDRLAGSGLFVCADYSAGDDIASEGGALGLVVSGRVRVSRDDDDREVTLNILPTGGCFGAAGMFGGGKTTHTRITAITASIVAFIGEGDFTALLTGNGTLSLAYIRFLSDRIRFLNGKVKAFSGSTTAEKTAQALLSAAVGGVVSISCAELARRLNIGRASLYRALDAMEESALISRDGKKIMITDAEGLFRFR